ncbi:MAG: cell division topological specificity factor MinE [Geminicoccaceae bacterium]|nr:cell division topological specificity factor MinE [Geminicoccaceae bacterium]MCS7266557.1 cell division topological specificity factor MinE [Geminicoccaceae bacterium]MCX7628984.1 cell division topological specificity factor MinE [Geminicoccaceae bacterium]MDW8125620.1 cell division topological specificity factor MinE [Geminicoccaceae bacterium]MDW8340090.1 cell division topological specificity factor MinE [Geminicoccaceae bacterium]
MKLKDLFDLFRGPGRSTGSAARAKERLQVILAVERPLTRGQPDFLPLLQREILEVIRKYVPIDERRIKIEVEREADMSLLAVSIELPHATLSRAL